MKVCAWPGMRERSVNPYTWLIYAPMIDDGVQVVEYQRWSLKAAACDVLHVHWPESVFWGRIAGMGALTRKLCAHLTLARIDQVRRSGGILVWTAHNLVPHAAMTGSDERIWRDYFKAFLERVDLVISLTHTAEQMLLDAYPDLRDRRRAVIPHPDYRTAYPPPPPQAEARAALGLPLEGTCLYSIGYMRPAKGLDELITAFRAAAKADEMLLLAGGADPGYAGSLRELAGEDPRIRIMARHLDDQEVATVVSAADGFVMNHQTVLNSGSVLLALSFDRPALARCQGSVAELAGMVGKDWVTPLAGRLDPAAIRSFLDALRSRPGGRRAPLDGFDAAAISAATLAQYAKALEARRGSIVAAR